MIYQFEGLSFQVMTVGYFVHKPGIFHVKARKYAAFSFRVSGNASFRIGNRQYVTNPGDILFLPADIPYQVEYSVSESIVAHLTDCNDDEAEMIFVENQRAMAFLFQQLLANWNQKHSVNQAKSDLYAILEAIGNGKKCSTDHMVSAECVRYLHEHFCDPDLTVETLAKIAFISPSGLQRGFHQQFGLSPKQYLTKLRMDKALALLATTNLSIKEIAFACGFTDEKYFSHTFKKRIGCSPAQYRKG